MPTTALRLIDLLGDLPVGAVKGCGPIFRFPIDARLGYNAAIEHAGTVGRFRWIVAEFERRRGRHHREHPTVTAKVVELPFTAIGFGTPGVSMTLRQALIGVGVAILAVIAGGIGGFLSHAYFEIWFDPVDGVRATDFSTWSKIADGFRANFDMTKPQSYRAYYGENVGAGKTEISSADIVLRNFQLSGKIVGLKKKMMKSSDAVWSLSGYSNSERMVLIQRGPLGGIGSLFVERTQDHDNNVYYFGYFLTEDYEPGSSQKQITQCPFVMMEQAVAVQKYPTADEARNKIETLNGKCGVYAAAVADRWRALAQNGHQKSRLARDEESP